MLEFTEEDEALKFISSHKNEEIGGVAVKLSSFHRASNEKKRIEGKMFYKYISIGHWPHCSA